MFGIRHIIICFYFILSIFFFGCNNTSGKIKNNGKAVNGKSKLVFEKEMYNFGEVSEGDVIGKFILFKNEGNGVLIINSVIGNCECLEVKYSKEPVMPDQTGKLEVIFDTNGFHGRQVKFLKVFSNDSLAGAKELMIWADVIQ